MVHLGAVILDALIILPIAGVVVHFVVEVEIADCRVVVVGGLRVLGVLSVVGLLIEISFIGACIGGVVTDCHWCLRMGVLKAVAVAVIVG